MSGTEIRRGRVERPFRDGQSLAEVQLERPGEKCTMSIKKYDNINSSKNNLITNYPYNLPFECIQISIHMCIRLIYDYNLWLKFYV